MYLTSLSPLHNAAIKDMASNLERRWRNMISDVDGSSKAPESKGNEGRSCRFDSLKDSKSNILVYRPKI